MARKVKTSLICVALFHWNNGLCETKHCFKDMETAKLFYGFEFEPYLDGFVAYWTDIPELHKLEIKLISYITINYAQKDANVCSLQG